MSAATKAGTATWSLVMQSVTQVLESVAFVLIGIIAIRNVVALARRTPPRALLRLIVIYNISFIVALGAMMMAMALKAYHDLTALHGPGASPQLEEATERALAASVIPGGFLILTMAGTTVGAFYAMRKLPKDDGAAAASNVPI